MSRRLRQWTVDAFARQPFLGNPACVLEPFDAWPADAWMQALAAENNQAETAFLVRTADPARFGLRWFTPAVEVPLCGHATLASGHVLFSELGLTASRVAFDTQSGALTVACTDDGYEMDFPAGTPRRIEPPRDLAQIIGAQPVEVWVGRYLVVVVADEAAVRTAKPDLLALKDLSLAATQDGGNAGVVALADPNADYDVVSRFFAPGSGIPEDPTTGSWHCILAPLYAAKLGRPAVRFHQAFPGRGGDLVCEHRGDRVLLRGGAVTVIESTLRL